ncbi:2OG-Fe dioxygenase family protein [Serratia sp. NPDC078593]|uniref:2OG-Fe dioxygenase family protein n=1 Tax=unclassified Serratia (in: enterobacteria) TaxID=2647522 RepID=UPI0037CEA918
MPFFQSTSVNGLLGGIERVYPCGEHAFIHYDIMQTLLAHPYALLTERVGIRHLHIVELHGMHHQHLPLGQGNLPF